MGWILGDQRWFCCQDKVQYSLHYWSGLPGLLLCQLLLGHVFANQYDVFLCDNDAGSQCFRCWHARAELKSHQSDVWTTRFNQRDLLLTCSTKSRWNPWRARLSQGLQHILSSFNFTMIRRRVERGRYLWDANKVGKVFVHTLKPEYTVNFMRVSGRFVAKDVVYVGILYGVV